MWKGSCEEFRTLLLSFRQDRVNISTSLTLLLSLRVDKKLFEKRNEAAPIDRTISSSLSVDNRTAASTVSIKLK